MFTWVLCYCPVAGHMHDPAGNPYDQWGYGRPPRSPEPSEAATAGYTNLCPDAPPQRDESNSLASGSNRTIEEAQPGTLRCPIECRTAVGPSQLSYEKDDLVLVHGLKNAAELNGALGVVKSYATARTRWAVRIDALNKTVFIKSENLRPVWHKPWPGQCVSHDPSQALFTQPVTPTADASVQTSDTRTIEDTATVLAGSEPPKEPPLVYAQAPQTERVQPIDDNVEPTPSQDVSTPAEALEGIATLNAIRKAKDRVASRPLPTDDMRVKRALVIFNAVGHILDDESTTLSQRMDRIHRIWPPKDDVMRDFLLCEDATAAPIDQSVAAAADCDARSPPAPPPKQKRKKKKKNKQDQAVAKESVSTCSSVPGREHDLQDVSARSPSHTDVQAVCRHYYSRAAHHIKVPETSYGLLNNAEYVDESQRLKKHANPSRNGFPVSDDTQRPLRVDVQAICRHYYRSVAQFASGPSACCDPLKRTEETHESHASDQLRTKKSSKEKDSSIAPCAAERPLPTGRQRQLRARARTCGQLLCYSALYCFLMLPPCFSNATTLTPEPRIQLLTISAARGAWLHDYIGDMTGVHSSAVWSQVREDGKRIYEALQHCGESPDSEGQQKYISWMRAVLAILPNRHTTSRLQNWWPIKDDCLKAIMRRECDTACLSPVQHRGGAAVPPEAVRADAADGVSAQAEDWIPAGSDQMYILSRRPVSAAASLENKSTCKKSFTLANRSNFTASNVLSNSTLQRLPSAKARVVSPCPDSKRASQFHHALTVRGHPRSHICKGH